ncbi:hypothetical protein ACOMHN_019920 [Nucella lapillus]
MDDSDKRVSVMSVILAVCALANILLVICLAHTWKYWRQVKWYIILMVFGNFLQVGFTNGTLLAGEVTRSLGGGSTAACRFLVFMSHLGPSLTAMTLAALTLHVLLTCLTGCQGNRMRHGLVMGLFVLLALPMPLVKLSLTEATVYHLEEGRGEASVCHIKVTRQVDHLHLEIGYSVATLFFPLLLLLAGCLASVVLLSKSGRASTKGDEDKTDVILSALLGAALFVLWTPYYVSFLVLFTQSLSHSPTILKIVVALQYLMNCFPFVSAVITIVFAYMHAFRNRGEFFVPLKESTSASGERQKLVK